ncbi:MAG: signal peptidase I [Aeromicrobium sp.]
MPLVDDGRAVGRRHAAVLLVVALVAAGVLLVALGGMSLMTVTSPSMAPTHEQGSRLLTTPFGADDPGRGDVIVFRTPRSWADAAVEAEGFDTGAVDHMVKRVIGVAGDRVECCTPGGALIVNGSVLDEPYLQEPPTSSNNPTFRVTVPEGTVWIMGDNRRRSFDSRAMHARSSGFLPLTAVTGRPLLRLP